MEPNQPKRALRSTKTKPEPVQMEKTSPRCRTPEDGYQPYEPIEERRFRTRELLLVEAELRKVWPKNFMAPFRAPVDKSVTDYYENVTNPMDMGTVMKRLENFYYIDSPRCYRDIDLVVNNCKKYIDKTEKTPENLELLDNANLLKTTIDEIKRNVKVNETHNKIVDRDGKLLDGSKRRKHSQADNEEVPEPNIEQPSTSQDSDAETQNDDADALLPDLPSSIESLPEMVGFDPPQEQPPSLQHQEVSLADLFDI